MPLALILPRGDQWYLLRKPLIKRDKGDTLSLLVQILLERVCVCVCVCVYPIYSGRQTYGRTSRRHTGRAHRISPPSFCGACLNFYREKDSAVPFPRRPLSRFFVYPRINRSLLVGLDFIFFVWEKIPVHHGSIVSMKPRVSVALVSRENVVVQVATGQTVKVSNHRLKKHSSNKACTLFWMEKSMMKKICLRHVVCVV